MRQDSQTIKETIRHYLEQYDIYLKTIVLIQDTCNQSLKEQENLPKKILLNLFRQRELIKKILEEKVYRGNFTDIKEKSGKKFLSSFERQQELQMQLLRLESKLQLLQQKYDIIPICSEVPGGIAPTIVKDYKNLVENLALVKKNHPDLLEEVEEETGIHYLALA